MMLNKVTFKELHTPKYTEEEKGKIVQYLMELRGDIIRKFLSLHNLAKSGNKAELRERIIEHIDNGELKYKDLVHFVDEQAPLRKQHIFMYDGPESEVDKWRKKEYVENILKKNKVLKYLNARLPLILPKELTISSLRYTEARELVIYGVERRDYWERNSDYDRKERRENEEIELRAYLHQVTRGTIIFQWNLLSNTAILQISQLPSGSKYELVEERFANLISPWLNLKLFQKINLRQVIKKLHELEEAGTPVARSHSIGYKTLRGRTILAQSPTSQDSVLGESEVDAAMRGVRRRATGHIGNFYWLPSTTTSDNSNPLTKEVHTIIIGNKSRINFTTPNRKEDIEYVLSRVRTLSK